MGRSGLEQAGLLQQLSGVRQSLAQQELVTLAPRKAEL